MEFQGGLGPKKQNLWPILIYILEGNHCILRKMSVCQQLGMILENRVVKKLKLEKIVANEKWSPNLIHS